MSERMIVSITLIVAGVVLVFAGLDVDNAWTGIGTFLAGIGVGKLD